MRALALALTLTLAACGGSVEETFSEIEEGLGTTTASGQASAGGSATCEALPADELPVLTDNWTGSGNLTVADAQRAPTDSEIFTHVVFLKGDAPGVEGQVFVFAVDGDDLNSPDGFLVGADSVTREFFTWGVAASADSPMAQAAREAVNAAPRCLS